MKKIVPASLVCLTFGSFSASAANVGDFQINGFLSVAAAWDDVKYLPPGSSGIPGIIGIEPVYNTNIRKRPSFDHDSNIGLQFSKLLREDIGITTQFLAKAENEWEVEAVWAFLKWEPSDQWQFRAGRVRTDPYMLSDYVDVGYAYPWVRPPEEVYSQIPSEFSNSTGVDARFRIMIFNRDLTLTAFYGAATTHLRFPAGLPLPIGIDNTIFDDIRLRLRDLWSFNIKFGDEIFSVRAGYETTRATLDPNAGTAMEQLNAFLNLMAPPNVFPSPLFFVNPDGIGLDYVNYFSAYNSRASFMGVGYQFDWKNVVSMGELVKRKAATPIIANAIGWYVMGGYRVKQFLPHITFAREKLEDNKVRRFNSFINNLFMNVAGNSVPLDTIAQPLINTSPNFDGGAGSQSSLTLGIRWDIYDGVAIKGEFKHVHPDFLSPGLFDVNPMKSVNIYSVALDAVM